MSNPINPNDILHRILNGTSTDADIEDLRQWFESGDIENFQAGKYNVNIKQGQDIHNSLTIIDAMRSIIKRIARNNETLIQKMLNLLAKSDSKIKTSIVITMGEAEIGTRIAIDRLLSELESKKNSLTLRKEVAKSLGKVARGDKKAVVEMERIARFEGNKYLKDCIITNSKKINI